MFKKKDKGKRLLTIVVVEALDHYQSNSKDNDGDDLILYHIGQYISEDEIYLRLRSMFNGHDKEGHYHNILKSAIKNRKEIRISIEEFSSRAFSIE